MNTQKGLNVQPVSSRALSCYFSNLHLSPSIVITRAPVLPPRVCTTMYSRDCSIDNSLYKQSLRNWDDKIKSLPVGIGLCYW